MADEPMTGYSSAFDALMERTRQRFEEHSAGTFNRNPDRDIGSAVLPSAPAVIPPTSPPPASAQPPTKRKSRKTEAVRRLNERFGDGWSYEVTERRREGDELIVLCRVDIPDKDMGKTQFGSAKVLKPGERFTLQGTVDGVPIGIAVGRGAPVTRDPEESAFRRAVDVALAMCADLL